MTHIVINPEYEQLRDFIARVPGDFDSLGTLLHNGRNQVRSVTAHGQTIVIKRFQRPNLLKQLQYLLTGTGKAKKAYRMAQVMAAASVSTPQAIAYILVKRGPWVVDTYFVSEPCPGRQVSAALADNTLPPDLIDAIAAQIADMHSRGIMHGDLNLSNIFYQPTPQGYRLHLIDTNRSTITPQPTPQQCASNMLRLTHRRALLQDIARHYAAMRGYDPQAFAALVISKLDAFQRKKRLLGRLKGKKVTFEQ